MKIQIHYIFMRGRPFLDGGLQYKCSDNENDENIVLVDHISVLVENFGAPVYLLLSLSPCNNAAV